MRKQQSFISAMLVIAVLLVSGCNSKVVPALQPTPVKQEIKHGGQLVYGSLQEPDTLNPLMSNLLSTTELGSLIFSGLITTNEKGEWIADLAEVPTVQNGGVSADGLTITYRLRSGVTWHDGAPFTADDVKFTWQTIMNARNNIASRAGYDKIRAVDTPDSRTVVVRFQECYPNYVMLFNTILPKHILEKENDINKAAFNRAPIGTGPFKLKEWNFSESVLLQANPNYFRGKPNLDTIVYKIVPDNNIMVLQLKAGNIDIMTNVAFTHFDQVRGIDGMQTIITPSMIWEHLDFNMDNPLFQDVRVRRAICLSIDKQSLLTNVLKNTGTPAMADQPSLSWAYNSALQPEARDINVARELLVAAGWKLGEDGIFAKDQTKLTFSIAFPEGNKLREILASVIKQQLKEAGIAAELQPIETNKFFGETLKKRTFQMALYAWVAGIEPDNLNLWHSKSLPSMSSEGKNYPGWRNVEVDALLEQGRYTHDVEGRKRSYARIQELIVQECPIIPLYFRGNIDVVRNNVANYHSNPTTAGNLWNAWEWGIWSKK